jgi:hypothetical protein
MDGRVDLEVAEELDDLDLNNLCIFNYLQFESFKCFLPSTYLIIPYLL